MEILGARANIGTAAQNLVIQVINMAKAVLVE